MIAIPQETSEKISFWSFVFSIAVVVIHCAWAAETGAGRLSIALFRDTLARMAVPFFFACSGYLLARHFDEPGWWRRAVAKRISSLGMPYFVWTLALSGVALAEANIVIGIGGFGLNPCRMPALAPLWYVRCLALFVVLAPIFKFVIDRWRIWTLAVVYALLLVFALVLGRYGVSDEGGIGGLFSYGFSLEGLFYFLSGIFIQRRGVVQLSRRQALCLFSAGCIFVVLHLIQIHKGGEFAHGLRCILTPILLAALWRLSRPKPLPQWLAGCAFPIFVMHGVVIAALRYAGGSYRTCNPWLELIAGIVLPIVFVSVVRRSVPRAADVLFGGR